MGCVCQRLQGKAPHKQPLLGANYSKELKQEDRRVTATLRREADRDRQVKKLLLLGPGNSGKSTFFKQLLRIHAGGASGLKQQYFQEHDTRRAIYDNIVEQMRAVIVQCRAFEASKTFAKVEWSEAELAAIDCIDNLPTDTEIDNKLSAHLQALWSNQFIRKSYEDRTNLSVVDSSSHFFDSLERIGAADYVPSERDMLLVRTPTTGIVSAKFEVDGIGFELHDAGGQKSERSKWIHCFDRVTAVLFVASLSCFDQTLYEAANVNAMHETLQLWDEILNSRWFRPTSMLLFLNKCDLFKHKLEQQKRQLTQCFKEYKGDNSFAECVEYVKQEFFKKNGKAEKRQIYCHVTCATDKNNVAKVFNDVQNIVVNRALTSGGLM